MTAGVLRGQKSRFQLFGDTVNTASRMESTGMKNRIQISEATAALLKEGGMDSWVRRRDTKISAKGKGELQTFWLLSRAEQSNAGTGFAQRRSMTVKPSPRSSQRSTLDDKESRLIGWNAEILQKLLKQIVAARPKDSMDGGHLPTTHSYPGETVLDEVKVRPCLSLNNVLFVDLCNFVVPDQTMVCRVDIESHRRLSRFLQNKITHWDA